MKILKIEQRGPPAIGGVEKNVLETSKIFSKLGYETEIWSSDIMTHEKDVDNRISFMYEGLKIRKFKSHNVHLPFLKLIYSSFIKSLRNLKDSKNIVIHTHSFLFHTIAVLINAKRFKKVIVTLHLDTTNPPKKILMKVLKMFTSQENVYITGDTENEKQFFIKNGFNPNKVFVVPNGVNLKDFENITKNEIKDLKEEYNITNSSNVLFVGRLTKIKGCDLLIKAIPLLKSKNVKIIFAGPDFGSRDEWKELALKLNVYDKIIFTGKLSQKKLSTLYNACDVLVHSSYGGESFGITLVEAMACKKPVIGSRTGGVKELIEDGKNGLKFDIGDYKQLAENINILLENNSIRRKMGNYGYKLVKKKYTWNIVARKYLNIMNQ